MTTDITPTSLQGTTDDPPWRLSDLIAIIALLTIFLGGWCFFLGLSAEWLWSHYLQDCWLAIEPAIRAALGV